MNDEQIQVFVDDLGFGKVEPEELMKLTNNEFNEVLDYLQQRNEVYLYRYMNSFLANRVRLPGKPR